MSTTDAPLALPTERDQAQARKVQRMLSHLEQSDLGRLRLQSPDGEEAVELPSGVIHLLTRILTEMSDGNAITLVPVHAELTTAQAAGLLNVSRPYLVKLLETRIIPFTKVGSHRRIRAQDVIDYRDRQVADRREALDQLAALSQEIGLED